MKKNLGKVLLEVLKENGFTHFYANPGTEFTSLIEAFAQDKNENKFPQPILVPHEAVAVNMAYGAYLATGKPQVVMVHTTIGAANAAAAIMNASRMNIPLLFIAGRTPISETGHKASRDKFIHWAQESYDQGGMLREYMKWDYELRMANQIYSVLDRAICILNSSPKGPVYLQIPRELLLEDIDTSSIDLSFKTPAAQLGVPSKEQVEEIALKIKDSKLPLFITKTLGENPNSIKFLEEISLKHSIPVITPDAHYLNISSTHPMFCGYQKKNWLNQADLIINLGCDVPWIQSIEEPNKEAKIIHLSEDPLFQKIPLRTHRGDLFLTVDLEQTLKLLSEALERYLDKEIINLRSKRVLDLKNDVTKKEDTYTQVAKALNKIWDKDCILVNELHLPPDEINFTEERSYFRTGSASGLGWGLGAALGLALNNRKKLVVAVIGDGSYYFSNPAVIHWMARVHSLKLLTIILNNKGMKSIESVAAQHFPHGEANKNSYFPLTSLEPCPDFVKIIEAFSGVGYKVSDLSDLEIVLKKAVKNMNNQSQTLIDVWL